MINDEPNNELVYKNILFLVEKSLRKKLSACLLVCPQGQKKTSYRKH